MAPNPSPYVSKGIADLPRVTRLTTPLSSRLTGTRRCAGGPGDGGPAIWKMTSSTTASRANTMINRTNDATITTARLTKPTIASTLRAASNSTKVLAQKTLNSRKQKLPISGTGDKNGTKQAVRFWLSRQTAGGVSQQEKGKPMEIQKDTEVEQPPAVEMAEKSVQTNEKELVNRELIVGDIKLLLPSTHVLQEIAKERLIKKKELERPVKRTFEFHEMDEEQHLDELKEFAECNYVTRRVPKKPPSIYYPLPDTNHFKSTFKSMDEIFSQTIPKVESVTKIKERIRRKEEELLSLFDDVSEKTEKEDE